MSQKQIRALALCLLRNGSRILVSEGHDSIKNQTYYRPLGGGIDFGEPGAVAVAREIREELGVEITPPQLLGVFENIFAMEGATGHEVVFVYDARFVDESLYTLEKLPFHEEGWGSQYAIWLDLDYLPADRPLYPDGLRELLSGNLISF